MEERSFQDDKKEVEKPVLDVSIQRSDDVQGRKPQTVSIELSEESDFPKARPSLARNHDSNNRIRQDSKKMRQGNISYNEEKALKSELVTMKTLFVRFVYLIVLFQVSVTFLFSYIASDNYSLYKLVNNILVIIFSYLILLGCLLIFFMTNISQVFPFNYILLLVFTLCESCVIAGWTSDMKTETVILC